MMELRDQGYSFMLPQEQFILSGLKMFKPSRWASKKNCTVFTGGLSFGTKQIYSRYGLKDFILMCCEVSKTE